MAEAEAQAIALHRQQVLTRMTQGAKVQHLAEEVNYYYFELL